MARNVQAFRIDVLIPVMVRASAAGAVSGAKEALI
jgi:hypothetical protein